MCVAWLYEHVAARRSSASANDMKLQLTVRHRVVDWLQLDENAEHRHVGTFDGELEWDEARGAYVAPAPPPASAMEQHRRDGVYARFPQLRALAEVLRCQIISIDTARLYDRVPVFTPGRRQTLQIKSWRETLAPMICQSRTAPTAASAAGGPRAGGLPVVVLLNNGQTGGGSHFDVALPCGEVFACGDVGC